METIVIYDMAGNVAVDPERGAAWATDLTFETMWPKGYGVCTFNIRRSDIWADWVIRESYGVIVYDGATIVYQGRIETITQDISGVDESLTIQCVGWYAVLEERRIFKRWIDNKGTSRLFWPDNIATTNPIQNTFISSRRDNMLQVFMGSRDILRQAGEIYKERYQLEQGYIRLAKFDCFIRSGEGFKINVMNVASNNAELQITATATLAVWEDLIAYINNALTSSIDFDWRVYVTDDYDQNDFGHIANLRVEAHYEAGHRTTTPTYTQGQLVEDVILLVNQAGAQLSTDFNDLGEPGQILDPFQCEEPTPAGAVIERIASYGDSQYRTWGLSVWDKTGTSDGKPRCEFTYLNIDDYDFVVNIGTDGVTGVRYEKSSEQLYNNITVGYTDERDSERYRDSGDNALLQDTASVAADYRRDYYLSIGSADATRADLVGRRFINYHKDRLTRATFTIQGQATTKSGATVPTNQVRAGKRIKLLQTGEVFFIRQTSYDAETQTVRISPDLPEDNLSMMLIKPEKTTKASFDTGQRNVK